jgi:hypothetical protein
MAVMPRSKRLSSDTGRAVVRAQRLTRWAWLMLPGTIISSGVAFVVGTALMAALDVPDGALLPSAGVRGWLAAAVVGAIMLMPVGCGVVLALKAVRCGGGTAARVALTLDGLVFGWMLAIQLAQLVMG